MASEVDWVAVARRNSRSVQTTVGWIFWDPGAVARYADLGLPGPIGYIAARATPIVAAGPEAVIAAFGSISPGAIRWAYALLDEHGIDPLDVWRARDAAVAQGLHEHAPAAVPVLEQLGPELWAVVDRLPTVGRVFFGAHLAMPRPDEPLLSGWHAVNCLREWRGDTHWALVVAAGLSGVEASCLHNAWLGYEPDWLPTSRGSSPDEIAEGWAGLEAKGLARGRTATDEALALRQRLEDDTDRATTLPWELLGEERSLSFATLLEPPCELLLRRVDVTAGTNYQPASRVRDGRG